MLPEQDMPATPAIRSLLASSPEKVVSASVDRERDRIGVTLRGEGGRVVALGGGIAKSRRQARVVSRVWKRELAMLGLVA